MTALFAVGSWTARAPNEWDVVFDISSIPIEEEIELNLQVKFWNAFQNPFPMVGRISHTALDGGRDIFNSLPPNKASTSRNY
jgi:hypothetical protein